MNGRKKMDGVREMTRKKRKVRRDGKANVGVGQ
jgi:hypothetical protein